MSPRGTRRRQLTVAVLIAEAAKKPGAWVDHPWSESHDVVNVGDQIFLVAGEDESEPSVSLKHEDLAAQDVWRARYPDALGPTAYLANRPWSRVFLDRGIDAHDVRELVHESYLAVVSRLPQEHRPPGWDTDV